LDGEEAVRNVLAAVLVVAVLGSPAFAAPIQSQLTLSAELINAASIADVPAEYVPPSISKPNWLPATAASKGWPVIVPAAKAPPRAAVVKLEILLDRVGASPGVIDGYDGENLRKAVAAVEIMQGGKPDGLLSPEMERALDQGGPVIGSYVITDADVAAIVPPLPSDYGEMSKLSFLGYTSVAEELAERFHMDQHFLQALNPGAHFGAGETVFGAITGADKQGVVTRIEADKGARQVRAYDANGILVAAYPATIGSASTPSPSGTHTVVAVAENPTYTYNPDLNFKQGDNDKVLTIPPGPNGPVGSVWIALSEPTFGIHGTPGPSLIDKASSHGCVRLTNWDAEELAKMVKKGTTVEFVS
jgi:lipoprotein-anchoring transpeptidase ErfK/SrfK